MNVGSALLWGFSATVVLTTMLSGARALGLTRIDIPFMLGTLFTSDRDRAKWAGFLFHFLNGWLFAFVYVAAFESTGYRSALFGMAIGAVHAAFVLIVAMGLLPAFHPRMASETHGPDPTRLLEPPGFLALNYGRGTPTATFAAHLIYGALLGFFYRGG